MDDEFDSKTSGADEHPSPSAGASAALKILKAHKLQITERPIESLKASPHNARRHSPKQIAQLKASIEQFGFLTAVLVDANGTILAGHGRVMAARELGMTVVPTIAVTDLTPAETRAYIIADNKIALNAEWDDQILAGELSFLSSPDLDFSVELTGFSTAEIDVLLDDHDSDAADSVDAFSIASGPVVSQDGDLWELGPHRLYCGNALDPQSYLRLMAGEKAQLVISDVPYNVKISRIGSSGKIKHREFKMASGEMSDPQFTEFLRRAFLQMRAHSLAGAIIFAFIDWRHIRNMLDAGEEVFKELRQLIVWNKGTGGMGSFYRSQHELVMAFKNGDAPHINTFGLGNHGRYRTNVWTVPGINAFKPGRAKELAMHPTVKPVSLIADAIRDCSHRKGLVLDPFAGSGTIVIAAERTGRIARAIELDPLYVDTAIRRWEEHTGAPAIHSASRLSFAEIKTARLSASRITPQREEKDHAR